MIQDLGCQTNLNVIRQFVSLHGQYVMDVGCGDLAFTRNLIELGARVLAIDPDPVQAEANRALAATPQLEFREAGAEFLPAADRSVDGVFFAYSLHHVPEAIYPQAFAEVRRVLKPDGFLCVIEPVDCPLIQVLSLFHDEECVRAAAQQALQELAIPCFSKVQIATYHNWTQYDSWEAFVNRYTSRTFNKDYTESDVRQPEVREAFERLGGPEHRFQSPKKVVFLQGVVNV